MPKSARSALIILLTVALQGCAYSMVRGDRVREGPFDAVVQRTVRARGLPVPEQYDTRVIGREAIPELLREAIVAEWTSEELADYQEALASVGAWPPERDLVDEYVAVSRDELAGVYIPKDKTLYIVKGTPVPFSVRLFSAMLRRDLALEMVLAHELIHLLQHGSYPRLLEDDADWRDQDDVTGAVHAAIEGDATRYGLVAVVGDESSLPSPDVFRADMEAELPGEDGALARAPALLRLTLTFPYAFGYGLSMSEGWSLLDAPPASTEQVIHPERRREPFLATDLSAAAARLPAGCRKLGENTFGELGISVLLRDLGDEPAPEAWVGWDGDRYLAARCNGKRAFVWETHWDSDADAAQFAAAYDRIAAGVQERAGLDGLPQTRRNGRRVRIASKPLLALADDLDSLSRTRRVTTVQDLRAHFGVPYRER